MGNPSRGDDALGPLFVEHVEVELAAEIAAGALELLSDFQLQIEHALDVADRREVVFVDASVDAAAPFSWTEVGAARDTSATTHALSPSAVLATVQTLERAAPGVARVMAIRGERFELGEPLTASAAAHLEAAVGFFVRRVRGAAAAEVATNALAGIGLDIEGTVQGVGFRPWVHRVATELGLRGRVRNTPRGVSLEAWGPSAALAELGRALRERAPAGARVRSVREREVGACDDVGDGDGFVIAPSVEDGARRLSLPPDLATCAACAADVDDAADRHHGYAFTSCTACGPRYSIVEALPYDRARTSMAAFPLCAACAAEYADLGDRRFHAQAVACPACGPRLWLATPDGVAIDDDALHPIDPLAGAARRIVAGGIVGVQGLGGFHLACDATQAEAVAELRRRKRRDEKPFAIMVRDLAEADALAVLDDEARRVLASPAHPIVLAPVRASSLAAGVSMGSARGGVFLPYTPLHRLLLAAARRPLVMTSGNAGGEPIAVTHDDARRALGGIVDTLLLHDRPIVRRVEDSVVASERGVSRVVRRGRGLAPDPLRLPWAAPEPVLAVGGHLKNTACLVIGDLAFVTPHLGDLETEAAASAFQADVEAFERLLGVRAEVLVHDLHPDYASTRYALGRSARRHIGVQHHVAHVLATLAELGLDEPVLGVVFDGTGYGSDGTAWGAEILRVDGLRWSRAARFGSLPLAGGERAMREVWRSAYGALHEAFGPEAGHVAARLPVFGDLPAGALATLDRMIASGVGTVVANGMGRWFDAVAALVLGLPRASFEGQLAMAWEDVAAAEPAGARPYPFELPAGVGGAIDVRPMIRAVVADRLDGVAPARISARFHATIAAASAAAIDHLGLAAGVRRVVLSGGSLQNRRLERGLVAALGADRAALAREVPVNDGGLALGQAYAGVLALREPATSSAAPLQG
ncbi:MAG: carbamoyltransferase HypF [Myxococcota bacterium]